MSRITRSFGIIAVASCAAVPASAQVSVSSRMTSETARADGLHARAEALYSSPPRYAEAGRLLVRAARMRADTDELAVKELNTAARLFVYANQTRTARATLELAAQRALKVGDVNTAAHTYLDAALVALQQKDSRAAQKFAERAQQLAAVRSVTSGARAAILDRIVPVKVAILGTAHAGS